MNSEQNAERASTGGILITLVRRLSMVVVLTLAFFLSAVVTIYIMFRSGDTRVPDIIGKNEGEAKSLLEAGKFEVRIQRRADDAPANTVIETRPAPNSAVKTNSLVIIVVSAGPQNKSQLNPLSQPSQIAGFRLADETQKRLLNHQFKLIPADVSVKTGNLKFATNL
jgi:hypothetical protein